MSFESPPPPPDMPAPMDAWVRDVKVDADAALGMGWRALKQNYGMVVAIVAINIAISLGLWLVQQSLKHMPLLSLPVSVLISIFFSIPLSAGISYVGVKAVRGEPLKAGDIFLGFTQYWPIVGIGVLNALIAGACIAPFACVLGIAMAGLGAANRGGAASPVGLLAVIVAVLAMIVLMLFITTRLMLAPLVCLDPRWHRTDVVECLKISWRITRSCWGGIVVVLILTGLLAMATVLLLGVGLILLGWPLAICTIGAVYVIVSNAFLSGPCSHCGGRRDDSPDPCPHCGGTEPAPA